MLRSHVSTLRFKISVPSDAGEPSERPTLMLKYFLASDWPVSRICLIVSHTQTTKPTRVRTTPSSIGVPLGSAPGPPAAA